MRVTKLNVLEFLFLLGSTLIVLPLLVTLPVPTTNLLSTTLILSPSLIIREDDNISALILSPSLIIREGDNISATLTPPPPSNILEGIFFELPPYIGITSILDDGSSPISTGNFHFYMDEEGVFTHTHS